jgi:uncharacterized SAM-binding protein YcdF (DUF218 family)
MRYFILLLLVSCRSPTDIPLRYSDAIILLAGDYKERVPTAVELYKKGYSKKIILTNDGVGGGWSDKYNRNLTVIEWTEEDLVKLGVSRENIVKLPFYKSGTIYDSMIAVRYARLNNFKRMIVVTSGYHARRALWCFRLSSEENPIEILMIPAERTNHNNLTNIILEYPKIIRHLLLFDVLHYKTTVDDFRGL